MGESCLSVSPVEVILLLLSGIPSLCRSDPTSVCSLLCVLHPSSVSSHSAPQFGNVFSGVACLLVRAMLQDRESLPGGVGKGTGYRAACRAEEDRALLPWLQRARHVFFLQAVQSHRRPTASLRYALLLDAVRATVLARNAPFYVRAYKGMGFGEGQAV